MEKYNHYEVKLEGYEKLIKANRFTVEVDAYSNPLYYKFVADGEVVAIYKYDAVIGLRIV
jgi:hypothetical protein